MPDTVPADPTQWSEASQRSVSAAWTREYQTRHYNCWRCSTPCVFTAQDQRYTYEVKKAPIDQQRLLCTPCWQRANAITAELAECDAAWAVGKAQLCRDRTFLERWAGLLKERTQYAPYRADVAKQNMVAKLLGAMAGDGAHE